MKDDDIVALEAKLAQALEDRLGLVEQVGHQDDQATALDLAGDVFENFADVGFAGRAALFQSVEDLQSDNRAWRAAARRIRRGRRR